jgi:hypothetical protein
MVGEILMNRDAISTILEAICVIAIVISLLYLALQNSAIADVLVRELNGSLTIFKASDTLHKYRVASKDEVFFYKVERKKDGTWLLNEDMYE